MAHILVIDDDEDVRTIVGVALQQAGHSVAAAADGEAGMALQRRQPADVVITDLLMPEKEGIETIRELKGEFPDIKIIAMSGGGRALKAGSYLSVATEVGADLVLRKPFGQQALIDAVQAMLASTA